MFKSKKSKKAVASSVIIIFIMTIASFLGIEYISTENRPLTREKDESTVSITVNSGDTLYGVFEKLKDEDIIPNMFFAKVYLKLNNVNSKIMVGDYSINTDITLNELIDTLQSGTGTTQKITFPEGYTIEEIAQTLQENGIISAEDFLEAVRNYKLPSYITVNSERKYNLEGFLFPDTYNFRKGMMGDEIIEIMLEKFNIVMDNVQKETGVIIPKDEYEKYITIASIIEKEAKTDEDRKLVSSVIYNRLEDDMPLQIDATVVYALGNPKIEIVTYKDLTVDSMYNTYLNKGLTIGAISNPGKESLIAAIKPDETDYLYYILAENGSHYFTNNYNDFLKKKEELNTN